MIVSLDLFFNSEEQYYSVILSPKTLSEDVKSSRIPSLAGVKPSGTCRLAGVYLQTDKFITRNAIT